MNRILLFIVLLLPLMAGATHNRAGEITYRHISGFTYEATITTCTKTSVIADREFLELSWGDGLIDSLQRESITFVSGADAQINVYRGTHTYSGPGQYIMQMIDPNRNLGVQNIPASVEVQFAIQSLLIIHPQAGQNNSVLLLNPAKDDACLNRLWQHNPGAFDPDGDLLRFSLITNLAADLDGDGLADPIPNYAFPDDHTGNPNDIFWIDENTGTVSWDVTSAPVGEYNIAILIEEFRTIEGVDFKVGHVIRDMQINIITCDNNPPQIENINDTCIVAFTNLNFEVNATDPDGDFVNIVASGGPLSQTAQPAFFTPGPAGSGTGTFSWTPTCSEVRLAPYQVLFQASDISITQNMSAYETMNITVIAPPVLNPTATPIPNGFELNWTSSTPCLNGLTSAQVNQGAYKIYRRQGEFGFVPDHCETGVPAYTGYNLIGTVNGLNNTSYTDTENVFYGGQFCYMVVLCLPDGSESIASVEFCAELDKEMPVITNVSVEETATENGQIYIAWSPASDIDTDVFSGPYRYDLFYGLTAGGANTLIYSSEPNPDLLNEDTLFTHTGINTLEQQHFYRVNLWSGDDFVASSAVASSIFLEADVDDGMITLFFNVSVPWINDTYEVFRRDPGASDFVSVAVVDDPFYTDVGLSNTFEYCYFVTSTGGYDAPGTIDPIINDSQILCAIPVDLTPPCIPEFSVEGDCENEVVFLSWTNPNNSCEDTDDADIYHIWYAPTDSEDLTLFAVIDNANDTTYIFNEGNTIGSIAGCYAITALDSLTPGIDGELRRNESDFSEIFCVDNCPFYFLPNIFSPNNDGVNDVFTAFPWKFVESVDFFIYNRWGGLVYETSDPNVNWNGTDFETGEICSDGTYYYVARVNTIRLSGIVTEELTGTITLVDGKNPFRE